MSLSRSEILNTLSTREGMEIVVAGKDGKRYKLSSAGGGRVCVESDGRSIIVSGKIFLEEGDDYEPTI